MNKINRKIIEIDDERCDGCGLCVPGCAEGAIQIIDGKARLVAEKFCDGLGACLGDCPNDALKVIERVADDFDEAAVEAHLKATRSNEKVPEETMACGCPSTQIQSFESPEHACPGSRPQSIEGAQHKCQGGHAHMAAKGVSALSHWPIQIRLVPPEAPFLKGADLLVLADCVATSYPNLHQDMIPGKVVVMGCPKLDDAEFYIDRLSETFRSAGLRSITVAMMEVPCCSGMAQIVEQAIKKAGVSIPTEQVIISVRGERLETAEKSA